MPNHLTLSPDERFLYVPIYDKGLLAVIDTKTHQVVARSRWARDRTGTQLGPTGKHVYVGNMESNDSRRRGGRDAIGSRSGFAFPKGCGHSRSRETSGSSMRSSPSCTASWSWT